MKSNGSAGVTERVVITGLGMISSAGVGVEAAWCAAEDGATFLRPVRSFDPEAYGEPLAGESDLPRDPELECSLQLLDVALDEVLKDSGWGEAQRGARTGVSLGTCQGAIEGAQAVHRGYAGRAAVTPEDADRAAFDDYRPGAGTARAAERFGAEGPASTIGMVCVSSAVAMINGLELIRRGVADRMLVGGFEGFSQFTFTGFHCIGALATGALKPFDEERDGTVLGEGAVLLTLERESDARARGAHIYGELAGGGMSADAVHMTAPDPEGRGLERAVRQAMDDAGVGVDDVDYISAHGTGTRFNDGMESACYERMFAERGQRGDFPLVVGHKSIFGHTLGAAGALDVVLSLLVFERGLVPPTVSHEQPLRSLPWDFVPGKARPVDEPMDTLLSMNSAFGGNNSALVLRRVEDP